ncbi:hemerythrin domain-containing protein [Caulobacter segnis]|uniref:hemerythrin domain-containing protein n=1 Tax=Caulobacter segnis TaxID=88688 RepID=UPI00240FCE8C|nr:hemerythrin domain-containing protein [Caulobacter segnis]MDG2520626.1 hemerythrin domain-containing protein [Caulobacter segnis]
MPTQTPKDAIALLKADHDEAEALFEQFEATESKAKKWAIAQKVCTALVVHTAIEEEIFYPAFRGKIEDDLLDEAYVEHDGAKVLIAEILQNGPDAEFFEAKVKVLGEEIEHHVKEEERPAEGMFAQARATGADMVAIGEAMAARKAELMAQYEREGVPPPETRSFQGAEVARGEEIDDPAVPPGTDLGDARA